MKLSYDDSFDQPLKNLNQQLVWKHERLEHVHAKIICEIDRLPIKNRRNKYLSIISYGLAFSLMLLLSYSYLFHEKFFIDEINTQRDIENSSGAKLTKEQQMATNEEFYEWNEIDGRRTLTFTEYGLKNSVLPLNAKEKIPSIISNPIVSADIIYGKGFVMQAFYVTSNHNSISIHNQFNEIGTGDETVEYFLEAFGTKELKIGNRRAVLSSTGVQIYIPTDTYIWYITGETKEEMIALAKLFNFDD